MDPKRRVNERAIADGGGADDHGSLGDSAWGLTHRLLLSAMFTSITVSDV